MNRASRYARLSTVALCAWAPACTGLDEEYRAGIPSRAQVTVPVPTTSGGTTAQSEPGDPAGGVRQALVGQLSEYYQFTRDVSLVVNGTAIVLLDLLHEVVALPPSSYTALSRTWGPYTPGGLDPLSYRVVVSKASATSKVYQYAFSARPRASTSEADWLPFVDGDVTRAQPLDAKGSGHMSLHYDNRRKLIVDACEQGTVTGTFDDTQPSASLDVVFQQFANNNPKSAQCRGETPHDATYHFDRAADGSGNFVYAIAANVHKASDNKPKLEDVQVRSRWQADGRGRSDVEISGGEVTADLQAAGLSLTQVTAAQCWDASFATVYETSDPQAARLVLTAGDPGKCAYTDAQLPR